MKILITGATGYIGHKLALEAARRGYTVHALVRNPGSRFFPVHPAIIPFQGDVTDIKTVERAMAGCEQVIHAAGITRFSDPDPSIFYKVNVEGTRNILKTALLLGVKKLVFTSTGAVLGPSGKHPMTEKDPRLVAFENDYEISKHWAEQLVREYTAKGLFAVIVAAPRVYGPGPDTEAAPVNQLIRKILALRTAFVPSCGEVVANYAFVDDVVTGHFLALDKGIGGEKYILGGENISYTGFFQAIRSGAGKKIRLVRIPVWLIKTWSLLHLICYKLTGRHTQVSPRVIDRIRQHRALSCEKALKQLGYTITPFPEGIQKTILHLQKHPYA